MDGINKSYEAVEKALSYIESTPAVSSRSLEALAVVRTLICERNYYASCHLHD